MKKLQEKYKNDRQKLNEELMKFYKENQINPLGGCLPLLAQIPVFIALYQTLNEIQHFIPSDSSMYADICSPRGGNPCGMVNLDFFGMNLTQSAGSAPDGFLNALPYFVLVALVVITAFFQQRQTMRNQTAPNPQMQIIGKVMPVVFGFISINIPAGVVLYFFTSNLWQIGQQEIVYRTIGTAAGPPPKKGGKGGGGGSPRSGGGKGGGSDGGAIEAKSTDKEAKGGAKDAPPESAGGVKGLFRSLAPGSASEEAPNENGKPAAPAKKASGGAKKQSGAKSGSGQSGASGAKQGGSGSRSGGSQNRRRNNRKRKR
jgi:YidC/Oxa1 family membrane protein insertase